MEYLVEVNIKSLVSVVILGLLNAITLADSPCPASFTGLIVKLYSTPAPAKEYTQSKNNQESFILNKYGWYVEVIIVKIKM